MRHRIGGLGTTLRTGLGNPDKELLDNVFSAQYDKRKAQEMYDEAIEQFKVMRDYDGLDFYMGKDYISFGIEPSYMYERLQIVTIHREKGESSITDGYAFGMYGSGIVKKTRLYADYKRRTPFTRFVDKWHPIFY